MPADNIGIRTIDFYGILGDILTTTRKEEDKGRSFIEVVFHHFSCALGREIGGIAIAGTSSVQPFFHGGIGTNESGSSITSVLLIAAHHALSLGIDDWGMVSDGNGIDRTTVVLGSGCHPALLKAGQFRALAETYGVTGADTVGAHPNLCTTVRGVSRIGFVEGSGTACRDNGGLGMEDVEFAIAHPKARSAQTDAIAYNERSCCNAVVDISTLNGFFCHDRLELLPVNGNIPAPSVMLAPILVFQERNTPAFQVIHTLVQLLCIGERKIFAQRAASNLSTAPTHKILGGLVLRDICIDGVHSCGTGP